MKKLSILFIIAFAMSAQAAEQTAVPSTPVQPHGETSTAIPGQPAGAPVSSAPKAQPCDPVQGGSSALSNSLSGGFSSLGY